MADANSLRRCVSTPNAAVLSLPGVSCSFLRPPFNKRETLYSSRFPKDFAAASNRLVAKTPLNSGKSTISGGLCFHWSIGSVGEFLFLNRCIALSWGYVKCGFYSLHQAFQKGSSRSIQLPLIVDLPEFDPVFPTSTLFHCAFFQFAIGLFRACCNCCAILLILKC